ncbi:hypothetical protein NVP1262O_45 [Vibrio phage 1.262.O._10N.286.51.A9]|nr:hypothetical protein NVP1262O_45 [Vibrio phage 1.262.O._10N.286.51.A9]
MFNETLGVYEHYEHAKRKQKKALKLIDEEWEDVEIVRLSVD